ncbi:MAG: hypothetical protein VB064_09090 [Oscillospiraceae bacterium]|nr:hypothetical protein [Oscillospiraceae bacterium]
MAAISGAAVAKIAATVLTDKKLRKGVGWLLAAVLSPLVLFIVMLCTLLSATSQHNTAAADLCFYGGELSENTPDDYRRHIEEMQSAFAIVDSEVARVNAMTENGNGLDGTNVKSIFYALFFGTDRPDSIDIQDFVDSFVRYEERTATYTNAEGNEVAVSYIVAIPLPMDTVYGRLPLTVTAIQKESAADVFEHISGAGDSFTGDILRGEGGEIKIDVSGFTDLSTKNSHDLVAYAHQAFENGWGYVWGTCGWVLTPQMFASKLSQYPDGVGKYKDFIEENWLNGRTTDCVGLIKGYGWLDSNILEIGYGTNGMPDISADQMYQVATTKGSMSTMPDTPGLAVWHKGHIGVYIGNGEVIEAMGTKYGVVKTKLQDRNWTAWLEIPYINYERTIAQ